MMDDAKLLELIPEYALGALEGDEKDAVEALLQRSAEARQVFAEYDALLVNTILLTTPIQNAPPNMTADFAVRLRAETEAAPPAAKVTLVPPKAQRPARFAPSLVLVAAALLLFLIGLGVVIRGGINFGNLLPTVDVAQVEINQILNHSAAQRIAVNFTNDPGVSGSLVYVATEKRAVLEVSRLATLPETNAYAVWLIDSAPRAMGVFNTSRTGDLTRYLVRADVPITNYQVVALTVEKASGSDKPTTAPIATGNITP
jgi:anti-sigma-K factor RskA